MRSIFASFNASSVLLLCLLGNAKGQTADCSGTSSNFGSPDQDEQVCIDSWTDSKGEYKVYPDDFDGVVSESEIYKCPSRGIRVIISNGVPDHDLTIQNQHGLCLVNWAIELPLNPTVADSRTEVPIRGMIAMALNGVPAFGPQESDSLNAVEVTESTKAGAGYWYGHAGSDSGWHFHNPNMGEETVTSDELLGYSMDGFAIYGPLADDELDQLDACNGMTVDGTYRYHVRTFEQVDESLEYCNDENPETNWNYILGCYSGDVSSTEIYDSASYTLDDDCVLDDGSPTASPTTAPTYTPGSRPNIIIMQPDDLMFLDDWTPPPNNPSSQNSENLFPDNDGNGLPNMETLRLNGLQMMQAYTASPVCGTSRYSTITGKMPSRAASVRNNADVDSEDPAEVTIPTTKLQDSDGQNDCSEENAAVTFKNAGYKTGMIGKWHLSRFSDDEYNYDDAVSTVQGCGFDSVRALYIENLADGEDSAFNSYSDGSFSHNMEWITYEAIEFINESVAENKPFFMYVNPTVPHSSNDVRTAVTDFSCQDVADPNYVWESEPYIKGMTEDGCEAYRTSLLERAGDEDDDIGKIWLDDSIGALLTALDDAGVLENTIFLFQEDHGMETKAALYENGVRIPQFIHYPNGIDAGTTFDGLVSTVDIVATMFDYAGITPSYEVDGQSWKDVIGDSEKEAYWKNDRCLFFEVEQDRAVRCGCYKYLDILDDSSTTYTRGDQKELSNSLDGNLFDLCDGTGEYITDNDNNREGATVVMDDVETELLAALACHIAATDPNETPDYSVCGSLATNNPTSSPTTSSPNATPTASPTTSSPTTSSPDAPPTATPTATPTASSTTSIPTTSSPDVFPTSTPTVTPTATSSAIPTASPSTISMVTESPTASPTEAASPACLDSPLKVKVGRRNRNCAWVVKKNKCGKIKFWAFCRASCGKCDKCKETKLKIRAKVNGTNTLIKCRNEVADDTETFCAMEDVALSCPKTCDLC